MKAFWTLFFLGSMLLVGVDVLQRREGASRLAAPSQPSFSTDPAGVPTPKPDL
jgi:hypothetical protein